MRLRDLVGQHLTIADADPETTVITDKACAGKAAFVIHGDGVTVSGLTFQRIRVPDGNGAGIRIEGRDLMVRDSRFINNEVGILAGAAGGSLLIAGLRHDLSPSAQPRRDAVGGGARCRRGSPASGGEPDTGAEPAALTIRCRAVGDAPSGTIAPGFGPAVPPRAG